jgi:hypothetical protein
MKPRDRGVSSFSQLSPKAAKQKDASRCKLAISVHPLAVQVGNTRGDARFVLALIKTGGPANSLIHSVLKSQDRFSDRPSS